MTSRRLHSIECNVRIDSHVAMEIKCTQIFSHVRHDILHWLDVPERVTFKLCMTVYKCLHGMGPIYLSEMCRPSSSEAGRRHLRSANRGQLIVPRYRLTTACRRAFSCAGPSAWNSLPDYLTVDTLTLDCFKRSLKCFLFAILTQRMERIKDCNDSALYECIHLIIIIIIIIIIANMWRDRKVTARFAKLQCYIAY